MKKRIILIYIFLTICTLISLFPFVWMLLTSFKSFEESMRIPPSLFPQNFSFQNYAEVTHKFPFCTFYINTFLTIFATVFLQLILCSMAAYAFARLRFPGRDMIFYSLLALLMVPGQIFLIPNYEVIVKLQLPDTVTALWLPKLFSAFGTYMLREFFKKLPKSLDESAMLDGCNFFQIYFKIHLPLLGPALTSLAILTSISTFKDLMWPLIVNNSLRKMTLSAGLAMLIGEHTTNYPQVMAGGTISILPMLVLFFIFQKQFVQGIANTGSKE